jgi:hypothetical protein
VITPVEAPIREVKFNRLTSLRLAAGDVHWLLAAVDLEYSY